MINLTEELGKKLFEIAPGLEKKIAEHIPGTPWKTEFVLTLYNDDSVLKKLTMLSRLETMFDDERNVLPDEYYWFSDLVPLGGKVKITMEFINENSL